MSSIQIIKQFFLTHGLLKNYKGTKPFLGVTYVHCLRGFQSGQYCKSANVSKSYIIVVVRILAHRLLLRLLIATKMIKMYTYGRVSHNFM